MKIKTLITNLGDSNQGELVNEHGLSFYLETRQHKILFDTGQSGKILQNADLMQVPIEQIDMVVISHGHYDHIGGLEAFMQHNKTAKIYISQKAFRQYAFKVFGWYINIGGKRKFMAKLRKSERLVLVDGDCQLAENLYILDSKPAASKNHLYVKKSGKWQSDDFAHEITLVQTLPEQLNVITGCCHIGFTQLLQEVEASFGKERPLNVIGGLHLTQFPRYNLGALDAKELKAIINAVKENKVKKIYTCHCTGQKAYHYLTQIIKDRIQYIGTGAEIMV